MVENQFNVINHFVSNSKSDGSSIESVKVSNFDFEDSVIRLYHDECPMVGARQRS